MFRTALPLLFLTPSLWAADRKDVLVADFEGESYAAGWKATGTAFGTGPGNFGAYYLHEKLPQASEEVKDPHQWLLEIAATVGFPGAAALLLAFAVAFVAGIRSWFCRTDGAEALLASEGRQSPESVARGPETSTERVESLFERRPFALYDFGVAGGAMRAIAAGAPATASPRSEAPESIASRRVMPPPSPGAWNAPSRGGTVASSTRHRNR